MYRDDEFPEGLSHSKDHLSLRSELEKLRVSVKKLHENDEILLGCRYDQIIRKTAHRTRTFYYDNFFI